MYYKEACRIYWELVAQSHCLWVASWDDTDPDRCFGDKGDVEDITEGTSPAPHRSQQHWSTTLPDGNVDI
jgi:hypothetical protein